MDFLRSPEDPTPDTQQGTIMSVSVVHFGEDMWYRLPVLRSVGYNVEQCDSLEHLSTFLAWSPDMVVLEEEPLVALRKAISFTRARSNASVVLFRHEVSTTLVEECDLIIPSLTAPEDWLLELAILLERSRTIRADSQALAQKSASLRKDAAAVREMTREIRARSVRQRAGFIEHPWGKPEPPSE
jgi:hypothetical protein